MLREIQEKSQKVELPQLLPIESIHPLLQSPTTGCSQTFRRLLSMMGNSACVTAIC